MPVPHLPFIMTKFIPLITIIAGTCFPSQLIAEPQPLTEADRIALEEQLIRIQKQSNERVSGLYQRAIQDYRTAIQSDSATMELYLKCIEKVRYIDEKRKASDFRDWKRRNKDRHNSSSMRMALRHQLSWLLLSIEAAQKDGDLSELGTRALSHLDQIFKHAEILKDHRSILGQNALGSIFARAYKLNIEVEDWPRSSMDIAQIYEKVVLPPLRKPERVSTLRAGWKQRIYHESQVHEKWGNREGTTIGKKDAMLSPAYEKFLSETRPQLLWKMEMDCYKVGDERVSAVNMLKHLENYITHKNAPEWIKDFQALISPEIVPADNTGGEDMEGK